MVGMDEIGTLVLNVKEGQTIEIGDDVTVFLRREFGSYGGTYTVVTIRAPRSMEIRMPRLSDIRKNRATGETNRGN
jgi:sRNA-binding carbon storage regulator CsrA